MSKKTDYLYGIHAVEQRLKKQPESVLRAWVLQSHDSKALSDLLTQLQSHSISIESVNRKSLDKLVSGRHQGIIVEVKSNKTETSYDLTDIIEANQDTKPLYLILDSIQDPHNLGACIRTAVAAGVTAVIIPKDRAVSVTDTVRKVASGAVEDVPIITVVNLARALRELKEANVWLVGLSGQVSQSIYDIDMRTATGIVMGGEDKGLREKVAEECDYLAAIPLLGDIESLNVSVATGVALYEVVRQRQSG